MPGERNPFTTTATSLVSCIQHANVETSNVARSQEWYKKVFDAEWTEEHPRFLRLGSSELHLHEEASPQPHQSNHFAVEVENWEGMLAHLSQVGIGFDREPRENAAGKIAGFMKDPDGNVIEVMHHRAWH